MVSKQHLLYACLTGKRFLISPLPDHVQDKGGERSQFVSPIATSKLGS